MYGTSTASEIWAVLDEAGQVLRTRGGSSTDRRLMVYSSEKAARRAAGNRWLQQVHGKKELCVEKVYEAPMGD